MWGPQLILKNSLTHLSLLFLPSSPTLLPATHLPANASPLLSLITPAADKELEFSKKAHENRRQIVCKKASRDNPFHHPPKPATVTEPPPWSNASHISHHTSS